MLQKFSIIGSISWHLATSFDLTKLVDGIIRKEIMDSDKLSLPNRSAGEKNPIPPPKQLKLDDLSMWKKLPYDNKYPLHKRPEKDVELFTSDLGKSLYEWYPGKKFELTSDKKTSIPFPTYISLHDPYLRTYFETLPSYKNLVDKGLITPDGKVKVHISEFNRYRMSSSVPFHSLLLSSSGITKDIESLVKFG
ncbi:UNVERIFIED_CONTAM: Fsip2 [Trichonephila clavipes]